MLHFLLEIIQNSSLFIFSEYLATFKKTVAMHEVFLCRLAAHPILRNDTNFCVFLEFTGDVNHRKFDQMKQFQVHFSVF